MQQHNYYFLNIIKIRQEIERSYAIKHKINIMQPNHKVLTSILYQKYYIICSISEVGVDSLF